MHKLIHSTKTPSHPQRELRNTTPEELLTNYGGFYRCPRTENPDGTVRFLGPLAGYTSKGEDGLNRVGPEYANFRVFEDHPDVLEVIADKMSMAAFREMPSIHGQVVTFCGIPTGGATIVKILSDRTSLRCVWGEKREIGMRTATTRADTEIYFPPGMEPEPGENIALVEDVTNAFSTTTAVIQLIESYGARVVLILAFLNRSPTVRDSFAYGGRSIRVTALWNEPMPLYDQTDPVVREAIEAGNFYLDTKAYWGKFMEAMRKYDPSTRSK